MACGAKSSKTTKKSCTTKKSGAKSPSKKKCK